MFKKIALTAAALATIVGAGVTANTTTADAGVKIHLGFGGGYYGGGYGYGYRGHYRPVYHGRRCFRRKYRVKVWSRAHGHFHTRWRRGRLICRY